MNPPTIKLDITPDTLTPRQLEVAVGLARGLTTREVAAAISVKDATTMSVKTVDTHRGHALKRLELRNAADLARWAIRHNLIAVGE